MEREIVRKALQTLAANIRCLSPKSDCDTTESDLERIADAGESVAVRDRPHP
jgi:hypothetical protein